MEILSAMDLELVDLLPSDQVKYRFGSLQPYSRGCSMVYEW